MTDAAVHPDDGPAIDRRFVRTRVGTMHVASCGEGPVVVCLHQTPRSWDEYRDVLPILGRDLRAVAVDTPGFGDSEPLRDAAPSIEGWADAILATLDTLGHQSFVVAGHHTGAVIALEVAARAPERVERLVLSAMSYVDADRRAHHATKPVIDEVAIRRDGGHLTELWNRRLPFYPADASALLTRFIVDALRAGPLAAEGHRVVNRYRMEDRIGRVRCPTLVLSPGRDPNAQGADRIVAAIDGAILRTIPDATVPFPDSLPAVFAEAVRAFVLAREPGAPDVGASGRPI